MTLEELKQKIDEYIGLVSELKRGKGVEDARLVYKSPTGILLFEVSVGSYDDENWQFGGHSSALPESWQVLCRIHRQ